MYHKAVQNLVTDPNAQFVCPLVLCTDKTVISETAEYSCHPVYFTLAIFKRSVRNQAHAWRPLGYISHPHVKGRQKKPTGDAKGRDTRNVHAQLEIILSSLIQAQQSDLLQDFWLTLGDQKRKVRLFVPVGPVIVDAQGGDEMCGRIMDYTYNAIRICRTCDASAIDCGNPDNPCKRVTTLQCQRAVLSGDETKRMNMYLYNCRNAWWNVDFGGDRYGIYSATCTEVLHAAKNGYVLHFLKMIFNKRLSSRNCNLIDNTAKWLSLFPRHHGQTLLGRVRFKDGITKLTHTTAQQKHDMLKCFTMCLVTHRVHQMIRKKPTFRTEGWRNLLQVTEMLLAFLSWTSQDEFWEAGNQDEEQIAEEALKQMMRYLQELAPRDQGQGWDITKVHEIKHMAKDISRYGSPANTNSGPSENHHIAHAKKPSKTIRKQRHAFDLNIANRATDHLLIDTATNMFDCHNIDAKATLGPLQTWNQDNTNPAFAAEGDSLVTESFLGATKVKLKVSLTVVTDNQRQIKRQVKIKQEWVTKGKNALSLAPQLTAFIGRWVVREVGLAPNKSHTLTLYTEYNRNDVVFRAHPNYQGDGPWNDWVNIKWEGDNNLPAQLLGFFLWDTKYKAIVHSVESTPQEHSILTRTTTLEMNNDNTPMYHVVDGDTLDEHTSLFPDEPDSPLVFQWLDPDVWANMFSEAATTDD